MRAGALRNRITLQSPGGVRNPNTGERQTVWTDQADVWASIEALTGREALIASQRQASTTHLVTIRYMPSLAAMDASWRVKFGTRIFTIDEPPRNLNEANRTIALYCTEGKRQE